MAATVGLDRDRAFYPTVTIVVASYYVLFAAMGASTQALVLDSAVGLLFLGMAVWGFRSSLWLVVAALAAHGVLDLFHQRLLFNPGVPPWWPGFCGGFDLSAAAVLGWRLKTGPLRAR